MKELRALSCQCPPLDRNNRIKFDGTLDYNFQIFSEFMANTSGLSAHINSLKEDCSTTFTFRNSTDEEKDETTSLDSTDYHNDGCTFFQRADQAPRCGLEELAQSIFQLHTKNASFNPSLSGAEWWTQVVNSADDIGFHWDKDYAFEQTTGINLYPQLATVTYLTDTGGPTVVLKRAGCRQSNGDHSGIADDIVVSNPAFGNHIKFDGRLLHAAPAGICNIHKASTSQTVRVTFLVNIWLNHIPTRAIPYPQPSIIQLKTAVGTGLAAGAPTAVPVPRLPLITRKQSAPLDLHSWQFNNGGMRYTVYVPLPPKDRLIGLCRQHHAFMFGYKNVPGVDARVELIKSAVTVARRREKDVKGKQDGLLMGQLQDTVGEYPQTVSTVEEEIALGQVEDRGWKQSLCVRDNFVPDDSDVNGDSTIDVISKRRRLFWKPVHRFYFI